MGRGEAYTTSGRLAMHMQRNERESWLDSELTEQQAHCGQCCKLTYHRQQANHADLNNLC